MILFFYKKNINQLKISNKNLYKKKKEFNKQKSLQNKKNVSKFKMLLKIQRQVRRLHPPYRR